VKPILKINPKLGKKPILNVSVTEEKKKAQGYRERRKVFRGRAIGDDVRSEGSCGG